MISNNNLSELKSGNSPMKSNLNLTEQNKVDGASIYYTLDEQVNILLWCNEKSNMTILPCKNNFFEIENPELYGPLWIYITLIFCLYASGNLSLYLQVNKQDFQFKFSYLKIAFTLVLMYAILVPSFVATLMKIFGNNGLSFFQTYCIYGYSLFVFIPVSILSVIPYTIVQICLFSYAVLASILFLINNFYKEINKLVQQEGQTSKKVIVLFTIISLQVVTMVLYKLYFFKQIYSSSSTDQKILFFWQEEDTQSQVQKKFLEHIHFGNH
ncbi:Yip1 domain protein [Ichthyophthirius multifiliis]|uniref:Protein YIPF n=1 Tax=Ichthyophthirius multifiliis TaxID=5932 RepID=G0QIS0_ICHMU|nr:Yip1 domain protein [Ichthyophthirius multifiliis]EGR34899.1 Yip1 domain protein [Ichthyophthirius multifiliis]|eukprot:XP_004040203.1 Yip1 domain protein [Ichthyophthirius multifiliis]